MSTRFRLLKAVSAKTWLAVVAVLLVAGQLGALSWLAQTQVKAAEAREARLASQRLAIAQCIENNGRTARRACIAQIAAQDAVLASKNEQVVVNDTAAFAGSRTRAQSLSFMPVAFAARN